MLEDLSRQPHDGFLLVFRFSGLAACSVDGPSAGGGSRSSPTGARTLNPEAMNSRRDGKSRRHEELMAGTLV